jgi:signal transduction histidine kinase
MEAVGQLAGGIAHDFNNLLTAILGNAQLAQFDKALSRDLQECLSEIASASHRAAALTRQLLAVQPSGADRSPAAESLDHARRFHEDAAPHHRRAH